MKKNYVFKVCATGEVFHNLNSAVNAAALSIYQRNRYSTMRISDPIAVKRAGGYAVHAFDMYGKVHTANIDVFVPATFTKKGKQIKVDGLNRTTYKHYSEYAKCKWGTPAPEQKPLEVDLEVYDVDDDEYDDDCDEVLCCEQCGAIIGEGDYEVVDGEIYCPACYEEYINETTEEPRYCAECGVLIEPDDEYDITPDGRLVCMDCARDYYDLDDEEDDEDDPEYDEEDEED